MSRALILADLHWDHWRQASVDPFAGLGLDYWDSLDLVILAGDISNKAFIRWPQVFAWFAERMDLAKLHVFPGNHDPYGGKIDREDKLITACEQAGVGYAQRKVIQLGNHRFLCCTLWTDMMLGGDRDINMTKAERVMNDYRLIRVASDGYRRLQPRDVSTQWKSAHATKEKVAMSVTMDDGIKRWTAKRKTALVVEIIQGKTTVAEASRAFDLSPSEIEGWVDDAKRGMENALRANPLEIREQYEKQLKDLQEAYGEAMLELRARKKFQALMEREDGQ